MLIKLNNPTTIIKKWGKEDVFFNDQDLCLKRMVLRKGYKSSLHFHKQKKEIFRIESGRMCLEWIDTTNGTLYTECLGPNDTILLEVGTPRRFYTSEASGCVFIELSTHHEDSDSYRVMPGEENAES